MHAKTSFTSPAIMDDIFWSSDGSEVAADGVKIPPAIISPATVATPANEEEEEEHWSNHYGNEDHNNDDDIYPGRIDSPAFSYSPYMRASPLPSSRIENADVFDSSTGDYTDAFAEAYAHAYDFESSVEQKRRTVQLFPSVGPETGVGVGYSPSDSGQEGSSSPIGSDQKSSPGRARCNTQSGGFINFARPLKNVNVNVNVIVSPVKMESRVLVSVSQSESEDMNNENENKDDVETRPWTGPEMGTGIGIGGGGGGGGGGTLFGTSRQRTRRIRNMSVSSPISHISDSIPSPALSPSSSFTTASPPQNETLPITPPTPFGLPLTNKNKTSNPKPVVAKPMLYSLKNASTPAFGSIGGPLQGLGVQMSDSSTWHRDKENHPLLSSSLTRTRSHKSSLSTRRSLSTLFGLTKITRKKVPSFTLMEMTSERAPSALSSHAQVEVMSKSNDGVAVAVTVTDAVAPTQERAAPRMAAESEDEFASYASTVYNLELNRSCSIETSRANIPAVPSITLDELLTMKAKTTAVYEEAMTAYPSHRDQFTTLISTNTPVPSPTKIRRKPVPTMMALSSHTITPRSISLEAVAAATTANQHPIFPSHPSRIYGANVPLALTLSHSRSQSTSSHKYSDSATTLTFGLTLDSRPSSSSTSNGKSLPATPADIQPQPIRGLSDNQFHLDVARILDPDLTNSERISGIGLELLSPSHKKSASWSHVLKTKKGSRVLRDPKFNLPPTLII